MAHAEAKDAPSDRQISERVTFEADSRNSIKIPVPQNVTLHIVGGGSYTNRTVTIKGGQTFYFSAGLDYGNTIQFKDLRPSIGPYQAILFMPNNSGYQRLAQGKFDHDPPVMKTLFWFLTKRLLEKYQTKIYHQFLLQFRCKKNKCVIQFLLDEYNVTY